MFSRGKACSDNSLVLYASFVRPNWESKAVLCALGHGTHAAVREVLGAKEAHGDLFTRNLVDEFTFLVGGFVW